MQSRQSGLSGLRLIKRRLRIIKRPTVWGTALIIVATVFIFMDYWRGYSRVNLARQNTPTGSIALDEIDLDDPNLLLSDEDRAIAVDIDTLPLLLNDFNGPEPEATPDAAAEPSASPSSLPTPLPSILPGFPQQAEPSTRASSENLFSFPTNMRTPPSIGASPLAVQSPIGSSMPLPQATAIDSGFTTNSISSEPVGSSPLQQALQRHQSSMPLEHTRGLPAGSLSFPSVPTVPSESSTGVSDSSIPADAYRVPQQTSPPLGTTGYTTPPTLRVGAPTDEPVPGVSSSPLGLPESNLTTPASPRPNSIPSMGNP
jgi:hypothetical protein